MNECVNIPETGLYLNEPPSRGSWQQLLSNNIGRTVKIDYNVSSNLVTQQGVILAVGVQYVLLKNKGFIASGDIFSIKFVTFMCDC